MDAYSIDTANGRFAVADGASTSIFAKQWSQLLVAANHETSVRWGRNWCDWLPPLQSRWSDLTRNFPLSWDVEYKLAEGAYSTFLNLHIQQHGRSSRWWATAVGDTCLFHVREDILLSAFPVRSSQNFGSSPPLVGTRTDPSYLTTELENCHAGTCQRGDLFFLVTDALAQWFLASHESGHCPWHELSMRDHFDFESFVNTLRENKVIQNDDATVVIVEVE